MTFRERRFTSRDGLGLYFRDYGDPLAPATPVLCLAGLTRNSKDFHDLAERLAAGRRVICPDYRGRGRSDADPDWRNYALAVLVDDVMHLVALAGLHRAVVVGTSLGGVLAMALAAARPAMLAGVVLNDVGPEIGSSGLDAIIDYVRHDRPQPDLRSAEREIRDRLPALRFQDDAMWSKVVRNTYRDCDDGMLRFDWDVAIIKPLLGGADAMADLWPLFRALARVPVLALRAEYSDILTIECFERMAAVKPDLRRVTVPRTGHAPTLVEPECVVAIEEFLADV